MVRFKDPKSVPPLQDVDLFLLCGPPKGDEWSPERLAELEAGWWAHRDQILEDCADRDWMPWAYWEFEAREPMPDDD